MFPVITYHNVAPEKASPKQGRIGEKGGQERAREREQWPEMKLGQPGSRSRKHKSAAASLISKLRGEHTLQCTGWLSFLPARKRVH